MINDFNTIRAPPHAKQWSSHMVLFVALDTNTDHPEMTISHFF